MNTFSSKSVLKLALNITILSTFALSSWMVTADEGKGTLGKGTLGILDDGKGTLGYKKKKAVIRKLRRTAPAEAADSSPANSNPANNKAEAKAEADKGTIGKGASANPEAALEKPGIERAHTTVEEPSESTCGFIKAKYKDLLELVTKNPAELEIQVTKKLENFEAKKFDVDPIREYLYVVVSTLVTLEKMQVAIESVSLRNKLQAQETSFLAIRNQLKNEITTRYQTLLNANGCR